MINVIALLFKNVMQWQRIPAPINQALIVFVNFQNKTCLKVHV
jgi:hypothetical protein